MTSAGSRYVYVMVNYHPDKVVWMGMNYAERVDSPNQLNHRVVNKVLTMLGITKNIEVVSISDVRPNSGVGSSSSFVVGLLNALHAHKGEFLWPNELAKEACYIERELLGEIGGKQDQYAAALGGFIWMEISNHGNVRVSRVDFRPEFVRELNRNLIYFYTGISRESREIQNTNDAYIKSEDGVLEKLDQIKIIATDIRKALLAQNIQEFGRLIDEHWRIKRQLSPAISTDRIEHIYRTGIEAGAIGANLMGAGGGGHFMFVCTNEKSREKLRHVLSREGLSQVDFDFELRGSSVVSI